MVRRGSDRERALAKYVRMHGPVPTFRWDYTLRRFVGVFGYTMARYARQEGAWQKARETFFEWDVDPKRPLVLFVLRDSAAEVEKTLVMMTLPTFTKMFGRLVTSEPERYLMTEKYMKKE